MYPCPDLMSDRKRSVLGPGWTWQWAMINHFVCRCVCVERKKKRESEVEKEPDKKTRCFIFEYCFEYST